MIILVVSDRLHLTFICFSQPSIVIQLVFLFCSYLRLLCSSFCVRENYFWQLFLVCFLQDINNYCIYSDYTVKLKTYLILILYLLSVFVCGTDVFGSKFLRLSVYQDKWNHFKLISLIHVFQANVLNVL